MTTHYQLIDKKLHKLRTDAVNIAAGDHSAAELNEILVNGGSAVETFLKKVVFNGTRNDSDFAGVINGLGSLGLPSNQRQPLHNLREAYNNAKHDPDFEPGLTGVLSVLASGLEGLTHIRNANLGRSNDKVQYESK